MAPLQEKKPSKTAVTFLGSSEEKRKKRLVKDQGRVQHPAASSSYSNGQTWQLLLKREKVFNLKRQNCARTSKSSRYIHLYRVKTHSGWGDIKKKKTTNPPGQFTPVPSSHPVYSVSPCSCWHGGKISTSLTAVSKAALRTLLESRGNPNAWGCQQIVNLSWSAGETPMHEVVNR